MEPTPVESMVVPEPAPAVEVALPTYRTKVGEVTRRETPATTVAAPVPEPAASVVPAELHAEEPKSEEPAPAQEQTVNSVLGDLIVFRLLSLRRKRRRKIKLMCLFGLFVESKTDACRCTGSLNPLPSPNPHLRTSLILQWRPLILFSPEIYISTRGTERK